jgi:hypothetical protein
MTCYRVSFEDFFFFNVLFLLLFRFMPCFLDLRLVLLLLYMRKHCLATRGANIVAPATPPYTDG